MSGKTRAIEVLDRSGVPFTIHEYQVGDTDPSYGEAVADAINVDAGRVFKTLVATVDGDPIVAIVPVSGRLSLKRLAKAAGGKRAGMADPATAQRLTGYVVGGISPFGQTRRLPMFVDSSAKGHETVYVSAGRRGLQAELAPGDLVDLTSASVADLAD